jgi:hypothetical protein
MFLVKALSPLGLVLIASTTLPLLLPPGVSIDPSPSLPAPWRLYEACDCRILDRDEVTI